MARTRNGKPAAVLTALLALIGLGAGCGDPPPECGAGTQLEGTACIATCEDGTEPDPRSGACVPVCLPGTHRDSSTGGCLPDDMRCVSGEVWDEATGLCLDLGGMCAAGTTWVASERRCVSEHDLLVPDRFEGDGFNDYVGLNSECEPLDLAPQGERRSFGGRIDAPVADWDRVMPDTDCWSFEVSEPTLLRVRADGLGGASAAFQLVRIGLYEYFVPRIGLGTTSSDVERDVFIAEPGTYALVLSDALNFSSGSGPWHGGGDFGYYAEAEVLPIPEPTPVTLHDGNGLAAGTWTLAPPEDRSSIGFYRVSLPHDALYTLDVRVGDYTVLPLLVTLASDGAASESPYDALPKSWAAGDDGEVVLAVDFSRWSALEDVPYELAVQRKTLPILEGDEGAFSFDQPAWSRGSDQPISYFGVRVEKGDVVDMHLTSSTGFTCMFVYNERFDLLAGDAQCFLTDLPLEEAHLTFEVRRTGLHIVKLFDWAGGTIFNDTLQNTPTHGFEVGVRMERQAPDALGRLDAPWSESATVTEALYEHYYRLAPEVGDAFRFRLEGRDGFQPFLVSYLVSDLISALTVDWFPSEQQEFAFRSTDGKRLLLGVSDVGGAAGSFDLSAERIEVPEVGPVAPDTPSILSGRIASGNANAYFSVRPEMPGKLTLTAVSEDGTDLALVPLDEKLQPSEVPVDTEGAGGAETLERAAAEVSGYFMVRHADGTPLAADAAVALEATLEPLPVEAEPNDTHESAELLELPALRVATGNLGRDPDWFAFDARAGDLIDIVTSRIGWLPYGSTSVSVYDSDGLEIASGTGSLFDRIDGLKIAKTGRYYILAVGSGGIPPRYTLEVRHAAQ